MDDTFSSTAKTTSDALKHDDPVSVLASAATARFGVELPDGARTFITCLLNVCDDLARAKRHADRDFNSRNRAAAIEAARSVETALLRVDKHASCAVTAVMVASPDADRADVEAFVDAIAWRAAAT